MNNKINIIVIGWILIVGSAYSGGIKKWVDSEGNIHFGDTPPAQQQTEAVDQTPAYETPESKVSSTSRDGYSTYPGYNSPQNQLKRMESQRRRAIQRTQERRARDERMMKEAETNEKKNSVAKAECEYYKGRTDYYERKLRSSYKRHEKEVIEQRINKYKYRTIKACN